VLQSRPSEPWWEAQQRALTNRAAAAAQAARGPSSGAGGGGSSSADHGHQQAHQQLHQQQRQQLQQLTHEQQQHPRDKGGLAGGDPMVAMSVGGSRCRACQAPTTTRCSKCKAVSYW
jgi:hypothetical protein